MRTRADRVGYCPRTLSASLLACLAAGPVWAQADPVFSADGPDMAAYGAGQNDPLGPRTGQLAQVHMINTYTHYDRLYRQHDVARAAVAAPLAFQGIHGQAILVDPPSQTVLVHTAVRIKASGDPAAGELLALWRAIVPPGTP